MASLEKLAGGITSRRVERLPDGGAAHHLASLVLTEGPEHQRIGVAWLDGRPGTGHAELTVDLAPGQRDLPGAVDLVRHALKAASELDVGSLSLHFDPSADFPIVVLEAAGAVWRPGPAPGTATIDLEEART